MAEKEILIINLLSHCDLDIIVWNDFEGVIDGYELPDPDIKKYDFIQIPLAEILN